MGAGSKALWLLESWGRSRCVNTCGVFNSNISLCCSTVDLCQHLCKHNFRHPFDECSIHFVQMKAVWSNYTDIQIHKRVQGLWEFAVFISEGSIGSSACVNHRSCFEILYMYRINCTMHWNLVMAFKLTVPELQFRTEKLLARWQFCNAAPLSIGKQWAREW